MKRLWGYAIKQKWFLIFGPLFKLIEAVSDLLNPILVAKIIDIGVVNRDYNYIWKMGLIILAINIIAFAISIAGQKCSSITSTRIARDMRKDIYAKISTYSHKELDKFGTASLVNRLTNDVNQIETAVGDFLRTFLRIPLLLIGAFVLSFIINIKMSLIFLVFVPLIAIILYFYTKITTPMFKKIRVKLDKISNVTKENLSGTRVIRAFNKQKTEEKRFTDVNDDFTHMSLKVGRLSALIEPVVFTIVDLATIAVLWVGGYQVNVGGLSQGDVIALIDYVAIITIALLLMAQMIATIVRSVASLHRVDEIMDTEPTIKSDSGSKNIKNQRFTNILEFKNVCFNYSGNNQDKYFIKDLSFQVLPHQTIGIIGGTGSGKSTIASLITRFYDVTSGKILYKNRNLKDYPIKQLRHEISIVQQRSTLFSGTLRENMRLRNKAATDEEIIEALKISQAWSFVSEWRNGLDYRIMAGGKNVSGGQMQRLTIARSIVDKPEILILDDSSSALDFLTDSKLRKDLKKLDTTLVMISQRATSLQACDLIIVLDNGDVVGMGKHKDLMKNCPIYKEIYDSQSK